MVELGVRGKLSRIRELEAEMKRRMREESIRYYGPHASQERFHADPGRIRLVLGGNRSGKSHAGAAEAVAHALGERWWLDPTDEHYKVGCSVPNKGLVIGESFGEQVKKVIVPKLLGDVESASPGLLPKHLVAGSKKNPQGIITHISLTNGSVITCQSYDQDVDLFEGVDMDWVWFDEPPPRAVWVAVQRGLTDRMGDCWLTLTPLKEPWIYDELVSREDVGCFSFDIKDNVGFGLKAEAVEEFTRNLTEDEKEARLRGRFFHLSGLVYKSYGEIHRVRRFEVPQHWGLWMHIDTHPRTPHHAVWVAVNPDGLMYVVGELANHDSNNMIAPFCEAILVYEREVLGRTDVDSVVRLMEPGAKAPNPVDGRSMWDDFADRGIHCMPGSKSRDAGILLMQKCLQYDRETGVYPLIYFFTDLSGVDKEMRHYVWDDWTKKVAQGRTQKQVPRDKDDHFIEGLHRVLLDEPSCELQEFDYSEGFSGDDTGIGY